MDGWMGGWMDGWMTIIDIIVVPDKRSAKIIHLHTWGSQDAEEKRRHCRQGCTVVLTCAWPKNCSRPVPPRPAPLRLRPQFPNVKSQEGGARRAKCFTAAVARP